MANQLKRRIKFFSKARYKDTYLLIGTPQWEQEIHIQGRFLFHPNQTSAKLNALKEQGIVPQEAELEGVKYGIGEGYNVEENSHGIEGQKLMEILHGQNCFPITCKLG